MPTKQQVIEEMVKSIETVSDVIDIKSDNYKEYLESLSISNLVVQYQMQGNTIGGLKRDFICESDIIEGE